MTACKKHYMYNMRSQIRKVIFDLDEILCPFANVWHSSDAQKQLACFGSWAREKEQDSSKTWRRQVIHSISLSCPKRRRSICQIGVDASEVTTADSRAIVLYDNAARKKIETYELLPDNEKWQRKRLLRTAMTRSVLSEEGEEGGVKVKKVTFVAAAAMLQGNWLSYEYLRNSMTNTFTYFLSNLLY